jgi:inward rectifier potassium channel
MALQNQNQDLGLGDKVVQENRTRFLNKDGSFNVHRKGVFEHGSFSPYHAILSASWTRFMMGVLAYYLFANVVFAFLYFATGKAGFPDVAHLSAWPRFGQLFFYSIQVISTLGSSPLHPNTIPADILLAVESMIGLFGFAVGASLLFARFSNPATKILFSEQAVIAPYRGITGFMFRMVNGRSNELIHMSASVTLAMTGPDGKRNVQQLSLERDAVLVFPLNWTVVHPIDEASPLYGLSSGELNSRQAEFLVSVNGIDQDLAKTIYARTSYKDGEVIVGAKFASMLEQTEDGTVVADPKKVGEIERI